MEYLVMDYENEMKALNALMDKEDTKAMSGIQDYGQSLKRGYDYGKPRIAGAASVMMGYKPQGEPEAAMKAFGGADELAVKNAIERRSSLLNRYRNVQSEDMFNKRINETNRHNVEMEKKKTQNNGRYSYDNPYLQERVFKTLDTDINKNFQLKKDEVERDTTNLMSLLNRGDLAGFNTASTIFLRNVAENKGSLSDRDVARELPNTLQKKYAELKQWITSNRDQPIPTELLQPMKEIVQAISQNKNKILDRYLGDRERQYLSNPVYQKYAPAVKDMFASYKSTGEVPQQENNKKIVVSNGKESYEIDASDLSEAQKDGFKVVK